MDNTKFDVLNIMISDDRTPAVENIYLKVATKQHNQEPFYKSISLGSTTKSSFQTSTEQEFFKEAKKKSQGLCIHISCLNVDIIKVVYDYHKIEIKI
jgi:hypothetical protein